MKVRLKTVFLTLVCSSVVVAVNALAAEPTSPPVPVVSGGAGYAAVPRNSSGIYFHEGGAGLPAYQAITRDEAPSAREARMKWFREARFGIFIHWGVYSVPARGEWYMNNAKVPVATYKAFSKAFTAAKYDPQAWAQLFANAGAKYIVITAKHHDGFTLYDSKFSDWNAVKASPAGRDLLEPLADAVRARGIKFGVYYSQSQDWVNPGGGKGNTQPWDDVQKEGDFDEYLKNIALPQIHEILDKYHPAYLFFDTEYSMTPERALPIFDLVTAYPDIVMNNRLGGGVLGDTATPEQRIATDPLGRGFEVCMTINKSWGYNANDTQWKSAQELIRNLSDISSKGGNYLLDVGPMADGTIPQPEVDRLLAIGKWLKINGSAIYGTEAGPYPDPLAWGRVTQRTLPNGGTTLYLHVWDWPADGKVLLPGIKQSPRSGRL
ncbi:MAG TPA: alpha-L-fucosidase, partial [Tepidisphaeraceae bacterium]|nr:alpha-L-fucosidase [Tepidisphaeraceae bacterium]